MATRKDFIQIMILTKEGIVPSLLHTRVVAREVALEQALYRDSSQSPVAKSLKFMLKPLQSLFVPVILGIGGLNDVNLTRP
jgi:hypothetical protein